jgi:hypothetical protein
MKNTEIIYNIDCVWPNANAFYWRVTKDIITKKWFGIITITRSSSYKNFATLEQAFNDISYKDIKCTIKVDKSNL